MLRGPLAVNFFRHHRTPRISLHLPEEKDLPTPLTFFDVVRQRRSNIDHKSEHPVDDQWTEDGNAYLSERWTGSTRSQILRSRLPAGHTWVNGRPTKIQQTRRPDTFWPEFSCYILQATRERSSKRSRWRMKRSNQFGKKRFIHEIDPHDSEYLKILSDAKDKHGSRSRTLGALRGRTHSRWQAELRRAFREIECELQLKDTRAVPVKTKFGERKHDDHTTEKNIVSEFHHAMVHPSWITNGISEKAASSGPQKE